MAVEEYDSMASYYDKVLEPILWKMRRKIIKVSNIQKGMKVLEVACGTGSQAVRFKKAGAEYTGVDLSPAMLSVAEKRNLTCLHADGTELPLEDNTFDLSTITLALHEVDPTVCEQIVNEMIRVTKSEGSLVLVDYTLPAKKTIYSSLGYKSVHYIEKLVGGSHYRNYRKFMKSREYRDYQSKKNMSSIILMKILESAPGRYDWGINLLTLGRINSTYDRIISKVKPGDYILDIGCGTGALTIRAALKGAIVKGIDVNAGMLEIAQKRINNSKLTDKVTLSEMGVGELGNEKSGSYDIIMSSLCFSELSDDEQTYTLKEVKRILSPGGRLIIADESVPKNWVKRIINLLVRFPLVIITCILTQTTTKAVKRLPDKLKGAGFLIEYTELSTMGDFIEISGRIPGE